LLPGMTCMLQLALDDMGEKTMPSVVMMVPMKMNDFLIFFLLSHENVTEMLQEQHKSARNEKQCTKYGKKARKFLRKAAF